MPPPPFLLGGVFGYEYRVARRERREEAPLSASQSARKKTTSLEFFCFVKENQIKNFPYPYSSTALMSLMTSIQSIVFSHCVERDWKQWKLGFMISGLAVTLMTWGIKTEGPFFVLVFQPVLLLMLALADSFLFDKKLHTKIILGGLLIVAGL
ncbi:unnamed protein product [Prunus brigantina]